MIMQHRFKALSRTIRRQTGIGKVSMEMRTEETGVERSYKDKRLETYSNGTKEVICLQFKIVRSATGKPSK